MYPNNHKLRSKYVYIDQ